MSWHREQWQEWGKANWKWAVPTALALAFAIAYWLKH